MQKFLNKLANRAGSVYSAKRVYVDGNLTLTPTQMIEMANSGSPIASHMESPEMFDDGTIGLDTSVPFEYRRGITASEVWDYQNDSRRKLNKAISESSKSD